VESLATSDVLALSAATDIEAADAGIGVYGTVPSSGSR